MTHLFPPFRPLFWPPIGRSDLSHFAYINIIWFLFGELNISTHTPTNYYITSFFFQYGNRNFCFFLGRVCDEAGGFGGRERPERGETFNWGLLIRFWEILNRKDEMERERRLTLSRSEASVNHSIACPLFGGK